MVRGISNLIPLCQACAPVITLCQQTTLKEIKTTGKVVTNHLLYHPRLCQRMTSNTAGSNINILLHATVPFPRLGERAGKHITHLQLLKKVTFKVSFPDSESLKIILKYYYNYSLKRFSMKSHPNPLSSPLNMIVIPKFSVLADFKPQILCSSSKQKYHD